MNTFYRAVEAGAEAVARRRLPNVPWNDIELRLQIACREEARDTILAALRVIRRPPIQAIKAAGYRDVETPKDVAEWMECHDWPLIIDALIKEAR